MGHLSTIAMSRGGSIRGLTGEGAGSRNTSVARARSPSWGYALTSSPPTDRWYNGSSCLYPQSTQAVVRRTNALLAPVWEDRARGAERRLGGKPSPVVPRRLHPRAGRRPLYAVAARPAR